MAVIQFSSLVSSVVGSIGGTTFSSNRSGPVAKSKIVGKKSTTAGQQIQLQNNNALRQQWAALTLTQQQVWNDYASLHTKTNRYGRTKTLTGFNWFISINNAYYYVHGIYTAVPPAFAYPAFLPTFSLAVNPSGIILSWSTAIDSSLIDVMIYTTPPLRGAQTLPRSAYRLTQKGAQAYDTTINLTGGWEQAHRLNWSQVSAGSQVLVNAMLFAVAKSSGITGTAISSVGQFATTGIGALKIGSTFIVG